MPGNANLLNGVLQAANREIGDPGGVRKESIRSRENRDDLSYQGKRRSEYREMREKAEKVTASQDDDWEWG